MNQWTIAFWIRPDAYDIQHYPLSFGSLDTGSADLVSVKIGGNAIGIWLNAGKYDCNVSEGEHHSLQDPRA